MGLARRYILNCTTGGMLDSPSGMTYGYTIEEVSLLDAFSGVTDYGTGTTYSYSAITTTELGDLTSVEYDQRVIDFLSYVGAGRINLTGITELLNFSGRTVYAPSI